MKATDQNVQMCMQTDLNPLCSLWGLYQDSMVAKCMGKNLGQELSASELSYLCFPSPTNILVILLAKFLEELDDFLSRVLDGVSPLLAEITQEILKVRTL